MRVSSFQIHSQATQQLQLLGAQAAHSQQQIASGKRLVVPGDDPVGAAQLIGVNQELGEREQFVSNGNSADNQLALEDSVLKQVTELIQRVQELTIQAGSGVQTHEDRQFIALEIEARFGELMSLVNVTNSNGQFLFSGFKGSSPPFASIDGQIRYEGDAGQRRVQVDRGQFVETSDSGERVFMQIPSSFTRATLEQGATDTATVRQLQVIDQEALDAVFPEKLMIEFQDPSLSGGVANFTVRRVSDQRPVEGLENIPYPGPESIEVGGLSFIVDGSPQMGDQFVIATTQLQSIFDTVKGVADGLHDTDAAKDPDAFKLLIERTIAGLNGASDRLLSVRAEVGARFNSLSAAKDLHQDISLQLHEVRSNIEDLDFAEAVSNLAFQSFVLEAAQQSFIRINGLSLFNRL